MTEYKKYPQYKDSGVEWLGQIPQNWKSAKLLHVADFNSGSTPDTDNLSFWDFQGNGIPWVAIGDMSGDKTVVQSSKKHLTEEGVKSKNLKILPAGTILFAMYASVGEVAILDLDATCNQALLGISPKKNMDSKFCFYALKAINSWLPNLYRSSTQNNLNAEQVKGLKLPFPHLKTQHKIAEFLDKETAHIDAGISHMESLIALLTEKRAALVSETVTRGIPGEHTEFKDSGVDWLGEIPASWDIAKVRDFFTERREKNDLGQKANYLSLMANRGVIPYAEKGNIGNKMPEDLSNTKKIFRGDFVINSMNYGIGSFGDSSYDGVCSSVYVVLTPQPKVYNKFAYLLLSNMDVAKYAQSFGKGILAHRCAIGWDILRCLGMPLPPEKEQYKIVDFLNTETQKIDKTISSVKSSIKLLKEKRQVLISDVVTGKIDVSNEVN